MSMEGVVRDVEQPTRPWLIISEISEYACAREEDVVAFLGCLPHTGRSVVISEDDKIEEVREEQLIHPHSSS